MTADKGNKKTHKNKPPCMSPQANYIDRKVGEVSANFFADRWVSRSGSPTAIISVFYTEEST
jgi:hypothetical protein